MLLSKIVVVGFCASAQALTYQFTSTPLIGDGACNVGWTSHCGATLDGQFTVTDAWFSQNLSATGASFSASWAEDGLSSGDAGWVADARFTLRNVDGSRQEIDALHDRGNYFAAHLSFDIAADFSLTSVSFWSENDRPDIHVGLSGADVRYYDNAYGGVAWSWQAPQDFALAPVAQPTHAPLPAAGLLGLAGLMLLRIVARRRLA